ncbi:DUF3099 domain-containing protein [Nocardia zapadnayensis]|uniref:DUF3099 domain-containing protein n=1 Tax=Brevibacterium pityocampae TaxID=506594 RepID=A0ABP8JDK1_9MICO|nr:MULTISPECIES: DUF3099 domain-containing protein [Actinomycetes]MCK1802466.1 DUF3099 domain-containing protein [Brevibacterium sp. R8603A2]MCX0277592.1 DUF3099 domain-containing protein [Nocardia zapadnayensis]
MAHRTHAQRITEAEVSHEQDIHTRTVRYLISMGIRMLCFLLAVLTPSPWRWFFAAGAIVLPWVAVLIANAARARGTESGGAVIDSAPLEALAPGPVDGPRSGTDDAGAGAEAPAAPAATAADGVYDGEIIDGEVIDGDTAQSGDSDSAPDAGDPDAGRYGGTNEGNGGRRR